MRACVLDLREGLRVEVFRVCRPGSAPLETANRAAEAATNGGGGSGGAATSDETRDSDAAATGGSSTWTYDWLVPPGADRDPAS